MGARRDYIERTPVVYFPCGKWSFDLLAIIQIRPFGFNELQRLFPLISPRILSATLKELTERALVERLVIGKRRVSYSITEEGRRVFGLFAELNRYLNDATVTCRDGHPNNHPCHVGVRIEGDLLPHAIVPLRPIAITR